MSSNLHFAMFSPRATLEDEVSDAERRWYLYIDKAVYEQCLTLFDPREFRTVDEISWEKPPSSTQRQRPEKEIQPKQHSLCAEWLIRCRAFLFFLF